LLPLGQQSAKVHRLTSLLAEVPLVARVEVMLVVSELLAKEMIPHESVTLEEEEERALLFSSVSLVTWCFWGLSS